MTGPATFGESPLSESVSASAALGTDVMALCPYPGLDAFTEQFRRYFVGRKRDTELLVANLYASPLTILYGASGVGKSSVLLAGVVPRVADANDAIVIVHRTWQSASLIASLGTKLVTAVEAKTGKKSGVDGTRPIDQVVEELSATWDGPFLFIFDQFEEYFLYPLEPTSPDSFDAAFARAVNRRSLDVHFMISLREDALSGLDRFRHRIPSLLTNLYRLEFLTRDEIRRAILEPLATLKELYPNAPVPNEADASLADLIVSDQVAFEQGGEGSANAQNKDRFVTPFLQLVLRRLWEEEARASSPTLRATTFEKLGRATGVVRLRIHDALSSLTPDEQKIAASVLRYLVTPSGAKVALGVGDLAGYVSASADDLRGILLKLSAQEQRILRAVQHPSGRAELTRFEIYHDALARPLLDWRVAFDRALAEHEASEAARRESREREAARRHKLVVRARNLGIGAVLFAMAWGGVRGIQGMSGRSAASALAARATERIDQNRGVSLLLALEALQRDPTSAEGDEVLRRALFEAGEVAQERLGADPDALVLSPDGAWLMALSSTDTTHVLDTSSLTDTLNIWRDSSRVVDARFSADSRILAVVFDDRTLRLYDVTAGKESGRRENVCESQPRSVAVTAAAAQIFVSCDDGEIRSWRSTNTNELPVLLATTSAAGYDLRTSTDGAHVVAFVAGAALREVDVRNMRLGPPLSTGGDGPNEILWTNAGRLIGVHWTSPHVDEFSLDGSQRAERWTTKCTPTALDVARKSPILLIGCEDGAMTQSVIPFVGPVQNALTNIVHQNVQQRGVAPRVGPLPELRLTGHAGAVTAAEVSDDGRLGFSIGPEGAIVWDLATQRSLRAIRPVSGTFSKGIFLRDNAHLATVTSDGVLQLWALDAARRMFAGTAAGHLGAALSPRGARYIVSANEREGARLWPTDGSGATWEIGVASRLASIPAFTPDESRLAMMWGDGEVTEFDVEKRRKTWESKAHAIGGAADASLASKKGALSYSTVSETGESALATKGEVQYSADGKVLMAAAFMREQNSRASSRLNARIRVYQVGTSAAPRELDIVRNATYVALSPDSRAIAVALANGEVREYDLAKSSWATRVLPNGAGVVALGYRPDGSLFVARGNELLVAPPPQASRRGGGGSIPVPSRTLASAAASLSSFAVSANKPYIAFGDSVGNAEVWDVDANRRLCSLPTVHSDRVASLAFAPSGAILATGSADRSVAMSSIDGPLGCRFLYRIQPNEQQVMGVAFKQSAPPFLVVTNAGGVARLYERTLWAPRDSLVALAVKRLGGRKLSAAERREYKLRPSP